MPEPCVKALCLLAVVFSAQVCAEEADEAEDNDEFFLENTPIVLTATRLKQSLADAPAAMTVIDRSMIEASGAKEVVELMRLVPGMQVGFRRGHFPSVTYHGMSDEFSKGMQILIDGQSIYLASFSGTPWFDLPIAIEDIERIEVVRGPNSATYGPNSFLGVINIITTHAALDQGAALDFRGGTQEYLRGMAGYGGALGKLNYRVRYMHRQDSGFVTQSDDSNKNLVSSRFDYQLTPRDAFSFNFGYSQGQTQLGDPGIFTIDPVRREDHDFIATQLTWEHQFASEQSLTLKLNYHRQDVEDKFVSNGLNLNNDQLSERIDFEGQHSFSPFSGAMLVWGAGIRNDRMRLPFWLGTDDDKTNFSYRFFGNLEWQLWNRVTLNIGALVEENQITETDFSPRLAVNYHFIPGQTLRLSASRSSRMPSLTEKFINNPHTVPSIVPFRFESNDDLNLEKVNTYEAGYHGMFLNNALVADMKFSYQVFEGLGNVTRIGFDPVSGEPVLFYDNDSEVTALNYELQIDYRPDHRALLHFGYSWTDLSGDASPFQFQYQDSAPLHTLNFLGSYLFPHGWQASAAYYFRTNMNYLRVVEDIGDFHRLDLMLKKDFVLTERQHFDISVIYQNYLGTESDFNQDNTVSDRVFVELSYRFH